MRATLVTVGLLLTASVAFVPQASALQCHEAPSNGSVVDNARLHAAEQCNNAIRAVYGNNVVRDTLDLVDYSCQFLIGRTCVP